MPDNQAVTVQGDAQEVRAAVAALDDAALLRPYRSFLPGQSENEELRPLYGWIVVNSFGHYDEHLP